MTIDIIRLKALATAAAANQYDSVALNDYGTALPHATVLGLIAEIERHRLIIAEGGTPDINNAHTAALRVLEERLRQIDGNGYTAERDDQYTRGQLADAAGAYAFWAYTCNMEHYEVTTIPPSWPWQPEQWKPTNQRQMLVRAGELILAEIARLDRKHAREVTA